MNAQVVCVSSRVPTESYYRYDVFIESLRRFAEVPTVLGMDREWRGLMTKPLLFREWLRAGNNKSDRLIICDSWDIVFAKHPHWVGDRCLEWYGDAIVFNAEKGCWPREDLRDSFPESGYPWRFLNSGFMCGPSAQILELLESMDLDAIGQDYTREDGSKWEPNDQGYFQQAYANNLAHMIVDAHCSIAQTLSACELDEFDLTGEHVRNVATGTEPGVFHFNGGSKNEIMPVMMEKWNLS